MKKFTGFLTAICLCATAGLTFTACGTAECEHDYKLYESVAATCSDDGRLTYKCSKCGGEYVETQEAKGHVSGAEATETETCNCTVCGVVLEDEKNDYTLVKNSVRALPVNYVNLNGSEEYFQTRIDTQSHGKYALPESVYYSDVGAQNELEFKASVPVREFYTHDILSVYGLTTADGKTFNTQSGFKVSFDIRSVDYNPKQLSAYNELSREYANPENLHVVRIYPAPANFGKIYEIVDYSDSYLEVAKLTESGYASVTRQTLCDLQSEYPDFSGIELSDGGKLFTECTTYRVMFKYSMAWAASPAAAYGADGELRYPCGTLTDRYDYFYVTVGTEKANVLLPYLAEEEENAEKAFYQLRADGINKERLFLAPESVLEFGDEIKFDMDTVLDFNGGEYFLKDDKLKTFGMQVFYYDPNGGDEPYTLWRTFDLTQFSSEDGCIEIEFPESEELPDERIKITIQSEFDGGSVSEQVYYGTIRRSETAEEDGQAPTVEEDVKFFAGEQIDLYLNSSNGRVPDRVEENGTFYALTSWTVADESIVTVTEDRGEFNAVSAGFTYLTCKSSNGNIYNFNLIVHPDAESVKAVYIGNEKITGQISLNVGERYALRLETSSDNCDFSKVKVTCETAYVEKGEAVPASEIVTFDESGYIEIVGAGTVIIKIKSASNRNDRGVTVVIDAKFKDGNLRAVLGQYLNGQSGSAGCITKTQLNGVNNLTLKNIPDTDYGELVKVLPNLNSIRFELGKSADLKVSEFTVPREDLKYSFIGDSTQTYNLAVIAEVEYCNVYFENIRLKSENSVIGFGNVKEANLTFSGKCDFTASGSGKTAVIGKDLIFILNEGAELCVTGADGGASSMAGGEGISAEKLYILGKRKSVVKFNGGNGADAASNGGDGGSGGIGINCTVLRTDGYVSLTASGGNGGNGMRGRDGDDGKNGVYRQSNHGNNGEDGENGGKGGNGGNGAVALKCSEVELAARSENGSFAAVAFTGGNGGNAGAGGNGGNGGNGADGGSSDHTGLWTNYGWNGGDGGKGGNGGDAGKPGSGAEASDVDLTDCTLTKGADGNSASGGNGGNGGNGGAQGERHTWFDKVWGSNGSGGKGGNSGKSSYGTTVNAGSSGSGMSGGSGGKAN